MRNLITKTLDLFKNKTFKETFWAFAAKAVAFFFFYLLQFYLARKLSVDDLGKWGFFFSFFSVFLVLSDAGLNSSTSKFIAQYSDTSAVNSVLLSALQLRLLLSFAFMAIYLLLLNPFLAIIQKTYLFQLFFWAFPLVLLNSLV